MSIRLDELRAYALAMSFPGEGEKLLITLNDDTKMVGSITLSVKASKIGPDFAVKSVEFSRLFVGEAHRLNGIGQALIACAEAECFKIKASSLVCYISKANAAAVGFYIRLGFIPVFVFDDGDVCLSKQIPA